VYWRRPAEGFLINIEPAYVLQQERVQGEDVRLLRCCLGLYRVIHVIRGTDLIKGAGLELPNDVVLPIQQEPGQHSNDADLPVTRDGCGRKLDVQERGNNRIPAPEETTESRSEERLWLSQG
jgi:hypothetical protein